MSELFRALEPEGFAILQIPISKNAKETFENFTITSSKEKERYFGQENHIRIDGKDFKKKLKNV